MAFPIKNHGKTKEKPFSEQPTEGFIPPQHYKSIDPNSLSSLELLEMQEEEKYINNIRQQRLKIEAFQNEVFRKDQKIKELEDKIENLTQNYNNSKKLAGNFSALSTEIKAKDEENASLRSQLKQQVNDYEYSLREIQEVATRERDEKVKEIRALKGKLKEKDCKIEELGKDMKEMNEKIKSLALEYREKEKSLQEQGKGWKSFERMLKDQVSELAHEKNLLQDKLIELKAQLDAKSAQVPESLLAVERKKQADFKVELAQKSEELSLLKRSHEEYSERMHFEVSSLQSELDRAVNLVARQENTIVELRMRKNEDDMAISNLADMLTAKENELGKITGLYEKLQRENDELSNQFDILQRQNDYLKEENQNCKNQIFEMHSQEELSKNERKQMAKMKIELLSQRNAEVYKLTNALDAVISNKS